MVRAPLYYLDRVVPPSIRRTGTVSIEPDADVDRNARGIVIKELGVDIRDARSRSNGSAPTFDRFGFEMREQPLGSTDFLDHDDIVRSYLPRCEELVRDVVGGSRVIAFGYNVRAAQTADRVSLHSSRSVHGPARVVHADFTLDGSRQWVADLGSDQLPLAARNLGIERALDAETVAAMLDGSLPWKFVTVWRNRGARPISDNSLAMCDGASVEADDLTVCEIRYGSDTRVGEAYFARASEAHRWWWYPDLTRDEVLLFKQWDDSGAFARSGGTMSGGEQTATFCLHSSFDATPATAGRERESIDVRCLVLGA